MAAEPLNLTLDGVVEPRARVAVANQVTGIVSRVLVVSGRQVEIGEPLFEIDAAEFEIDVAAAKAALDESIAQLRLAEDVAERQSRLAERGSGAEARATQAMIEVNVAKAVVARQESALRRAELALRRTRIVASIAGIVRPRVAPGAFVEAEAGTVLAEIVQTDPILVGYSVSYEDRQRSLKKAGTTSARDMFDKIVLSLVLPSGETYAHHGQPKFESAEVDRSTGMLTTWAEFPNPDGVLVPGLTVQVLSAIHSGPPSTRAAQ
ncbi:efflux RND transporter periplasmic adaptor subunit [Hyphomicrobium sp. CS1GBMeth3]|uniref:efflux RND transporter periplasmic adaptor subunit n=1 Tax=Hyphomicrobium sp. CS1GBMeth3 TaxID=1892845 RepID=UPI0009318920|nr:efflux RND transporter periplasmic adaptor subunit [Hyphomicrobium sp. CS1GBMeth3]